MQNDLVLCAFNCSQTSPCTTWAERYFAQPPAVVAVPGGSSNAFKAEGTRFAQDPFLWLSRHGHKAPGRIAVVTFSAGWGFIDSVMRNTYARECIDSVILLDGLHCRPETLAPWVEYAKRAALGGPTLPMLALIHSQIVPPYTSAKASNTAVYSRGVEECPLPGEPNAPTMFFLDGLLPEPITITSAYGKRKWDKDPLSCWEGSGNLYRIEYGGNDAPTHIYIAKHVQPRAWELLGKRWDGDGGVNACVEV